MKEGKMQVHLFHAVIMFIRKEMGNFLLLLNYNQDQKRKYTTKSLFHCRQGNKEKDLSFYSDKQI